MFLSVRYHVTNKLHRKRNVRECTDEADELYKGSRLLLLRARPHQLGESHCGVVVRGDGLIALRVTMYTALRA